MMNRAFTRWIGAVSFCLLLLATSGAFGGEADVFARLLARLTTAESLTATRFVMRNSPEAQQLFRAILGDEAAGVAEQDLAEAAIRRLQREGNFRLGAQIEKRLGTIEDDFVDTMEKNPVEDMEAVLNRLSSERLKLRQGGRTSIEFEAPTPLTNEERALADALHSDVALNQLKAAAEAAAARSPELKIAETRQAYEELVQAQPELKRYFPEAKVYRQLGDEELNTYTQNLSETLQAIKRAPQAMSTAQKVRYALTRSLRGNVPTDGIPERIRAFMAGEPGSFERAMGDMTLHETQILFHGGDPLNPTADSLLGKYIRESGAQTVIRTFDDAAGVEAGQAGAQGPRKLVVSLSNDSFPTFLKYFKRRNWLSIFGHAAMIQEAQVTTHGRAFSEMRIPGTEYTPFPMVMLKTTEGDRLAQYLKLFRNAPMMGWDSNAASPWNLDGYCAVSAWRGGCTQHVGNMPIGDERVLEYSMPENTNVPDVRNPAIRTQRLRNYTNNDPLVRRVWKIPGNQQFGEVIGQRNANLRGELANPGWLIWTLLGPTSAERVPFVFVVRPDARLPIPENFTPNVEGRW